MVCTLLGGVAACAGTPDGEPATAPTASRPTGPPIAFSFEALDGTQLTGASMRGRITVIGFAATYDTASHAQARFLNGIFRRHVPRINAALIVLEPPTNRPMIEAFTQALKLGYPVALADAATIAGQGPFAGLHHVPSIVILDREGREAYRHIGLIEGDPLEAAVVKVEAENPL